MGRAGAARAAHERAQGGLQRARLRSNRTRLEQRPRGSLSRRPCSRRSGTFGRGRVRARRALKDRGAVRPDLLWMPSSATVEATGIAEYERFLARTRGLEFDGYAELWAWSVSDLEAFWALALGLLRGAPLSPAYRRAPDGACPGPLVSRRRAQLRRAHLPRQGRRRARDPPRLGAAPARRAGPGASCATETARDRRRGCAALGVGAGDRVVAYLPNIAETVVGFLACASIGAIWSSCCARLRRPQRDRPLRPDRAEGAAGGRRLPLRRQATSTARDVVDPGRRSRARAAPVLAPRSGDLDGCRLGGRLPRRRRRGARRSRSVPFDHPLWILYLVGHDRAAEGDRPRPGRDPARAPEDAPPAPRRCSPATGCSGSPRPAG